MKVAHIDYYDVVDWNSQVSEVKHLLRDLRVALKEKGSLESQAPDNTLKLAIDKLDEVDQRMIAFRLSVRV